LIEYNPQRVKTVGAILHEALLRDNNAADTYAAIRERREAALTVNADFMTVTGEKEIEPISKKQQEFLAAVQHVIEELRPFWPVTIRKVHYGLVSLNPRPFELTPERSKFNAAHYAEGCVEVYAPVSWATRSDRQRIKASLGQPIREAIETTAKAHLPGGA
jgi:hypothetical protein